MTEPTDLSASERDEIFHAAAKLDEAYISVAYSDALDGPGQWEGIPKQLRPIAYAIHLFYLSGGSDEDGGEVDRGLAYSRAGRAVLWTDSNGFHELQIFPNEFEAQRACAQEDDRQNPEVDDGD